MKFSFFSIQKTAFFLPVAGMVLLGSCSKDSSNNGLQTELQPGFTVSAVPGQPNRFAIQNTTPGTIATRWDYDKGAGFILGRMTDTVFYPDAGEYSLKMQAMGKGGIFYDAQPQAVVVASSDPVAGNLVEGGKFNEGDDSKWTFHQISDGVSFEMVNGKMVATGGNWGHAAIYQPIEVVANKKYTFSMVVSGSGATDTWFEVYFGTVAPVAGSDYSSGGTQIGLNTWAGCGNSAFNGNIAEIGCAGALVGKRGEVTFTESGTIYLFIKTGGSYLGTTGIVIDNVELRGS